MLATRSTAYVSSARPQHQAHRTSKAVGVSRKQTVTVSASAVVAPGSTVLIAGATGGIGQLLTAKLLERGYRVRAISRSKEPAVFKGHGPELSVVQADLRDPSTMGGLMEGVDAVACCTGTTAFPSARWKGDNGPRPTDLIGTGNLIRATPKSVKRFVLVTSAGVERQREMPWIILNAFGVLTYKRESEQLLESSGLPYTILRPGRLTDGPYTSYDLNTLLQATAGSRQAVTLSLKDNLLGEASRIASAEAIVQALTNEATVGKAYALASTQGEGPGQDAAQWGALFAAAR